MSVTTTAPRQRARARFSMRRLRLSIAAAAAMTFVISVGLGTAGSVPAQGVGIYHPIEIYAPSTFSSGESITCDVTLTGAPAAITIYSDPPGAVSYQGTVSSANSTVLAATDANTPEGPVTIFLKTDGTYTAQTSATCEEAAPYDPEAGFE